MTRDPGECNDRNCSRRSELSLADSLPLGVDPVATALGSGYQLQPAVAGDDLDRVAGLEAPLEDRVGERLDDLLLDGALHLACAARGAEALADERLVGARREAQLDAEGPQSLV